MFKIKFNAKDLRRLKVTPKEFKSWLQPGFVEAMDFLLARSKIVHDYKNRTGQTSAATARKIKSNGISGSIYNNTEVSSFLYHGTARHWVEPSRKLALSWIQGGTRFFSMGHWVNGITADPWIEKNYKKNETKFLNYIEDSIISGARKKWEF